MKFIEESFKKDKSILYFFVSSFTNEGYDPESIHLSKTLIDLCGYSADDLLIEAGYT